MPYEDYCWWHLILTCRGQWLPGDPRGFRSRDHRIHSSGDYKQRPPAGEHAGLHDYHQAHADAPVNIPDHAKSTLGIALLSKAVEIKAPCLVIAVCKAHTHLLAAMRNEWEHVKREVGRLKQASSHAIRDALPGKVWAGGGKPIRVGDESHQQRVFHYIVNHAREGAWVWRYDRGESEGIEPRLRGAQARLLSQFLDNRT